MAKYIELLKSWKTLPRPFIESLDTLTEIANLFVIGPEALRDRIKGLDSGDNAGNAGGNIEKADLKPYILMREDARSIGVQSVLGL